MFAGGQEEQSDTLIQQEPSSPMKSEMNTPVPEIMTFTAEVRISNEGDVLLAEDWTSRSIKTYEVIGDLRRVLLDYEGQIIEADVIFLEKKTWSGSVVVVAIRPPGPGSSQKKQ